MEKKKLESDTLVSLYRLYFLQRQDGWKMSGIPKRCFVNGGFGYRMIIKRPI